ncbi:uncharacterized protein C19orf44 homolog [Castor canadensis]|uniref:Uncharacterized protein C19orf44 homolog n=2 Tax=Castor canadensis TaxID=51338 RepID=A0A8B7UW46_CASCN|nr:uncharacterized protein C19orf44 homolog [Castor canadensis]
MASTRKLRHPTCDISDFSDLSLQDSKMDIFRDLGIHASLAHVAPSHSRFLKRSQMMGETRVISKEDADPRRGPRASTASNLRASAALTRLAHMETKILGRKRVPATWSDSESDPKTPSEGRHKTGNQTVPKRSTSLSAQQTDTTFQKQVQDTSPTVQSRGPSEKGSRFLKKRVPPTPNMSPDAHEKERTVPVPRPNEPTRKMHLPGSDEEEVKGMLGSLMESPREKETCPNQGLPKTTVSKKELGKPLLNQLQTQPGVLSLPRAEYSSSQPSPPSRPPTSRSPLGTLRSLRSRPRSAQTPVSGDPASRTSSLSISGAFSKSASSKLVSSPRRSEAGPWGELVSEDTNDSLNDFRVNILSLDDLSPVTSKKSELDQKEDTGRERLSGKAESPGGLEAPRREQPRGSAFQGGAASVASDDSDVSECLGASSACPAQEGSVSSSRPLSETPMATTMSVAYSEDFECPASATTSDPMAPSTEAPDRTLDALSEFSSSLTTDLSKSPRKRWRRDVTRVLVKEMAVQTLEPAFAYRWARAAGVAAIGPGLGGAYVDPVPIASHVVSADAVEALTAYSPAALALHDMLKQQLSLTQQFIEASRHLHVSLLQSLDGDSFHYHTLEETKEYIRCHRPRPLTLEDALQKVKEEL